MDLHEHLRDLVARQGPGVVETAESFRAALDDYLTEDEATTGELNLLVDAVRLGGVQRLLSIVDHGAEPVAAVQEAGDAFARDRGTDDLARCRWAVAVVGHALGRVDEGVVRACASGMPGGSAPAPPRPPAPPTAPPPQTYPETEIVGATPAPATLGDRATEQSTWDHATPPPTTTPPGQRRWLVIVLVAVLVVAAGGVIGWILYDGEPGTSAGDGDSSTEPGEPTVDPTMDLPDELPSATILIAANDGDRTRIYRVDADTGAVEPLTSGRSDNYPTISRDRERVVFLIRTGRAVAPMVLTLATGKIRPLFGEDGACDYARRPGFNLAGDKLALVCLTAEDEEAGIFVVNPDGSLVTQIEVDGSVRGSPTWVSDSEIVYSRGEGGGSPSTLVRVNVDTGEHRPLTTGGDGWDSQPVWCDARSQLLFVRSTSSAQEGELWTLDNRDIPERLPIDEPVSGPTWSPGCDQLAFTVPGEEGSMLVTASADDPADYAPVDDVPGEITVPVWDTR